MNKILTRLIGLPIGLFNGILKLAVDHSRDFANKRKFSGSLIDNGCCFTDDTTIGKNAQILTGVLLNHCSVGGYSYISYNTRVQNAVIGRYCSISSDVRIGLGKHPTHLFSTSPVFYKKENTLKVRWVDEDIDFQEYQQITVGSDVWIGSNAIVMDGVQIGHGAVIAAGAVVTKDVPPFAIMGGVPAKIIKYRFTEDVIAKLLDSAWWEKEPEQIYKIREELNEVTENEYVKAAFH